MPSMSGCAVLGRGGLCLPAGNQAVTCSAAAVVHFHSFQVLDEMVQRNLFYLDSGTTSSVKYVCLVNSATGARGI